MSFISTHSRGARATLAALAATGLLALTACGSGSPSGAEGDDAASGGGGADSGELTQVTVGVLPIAPSIGVKYGIEQGIFEEHGLDVEISTSNAGAAMLPAVTSGQLDFGVGNPLSVLTAVDQGLDMRIVAGYSNSLGEGDDIAGVVTLADSDIESYADLEGKTTSVNALRTLGDLTIMADAEEEGADPTSLNFSEMPFPDMQAQLEAGNTDAIWVPEPFLSNALAEETNRLVGYSFQDAIPGMPTMVTFTSGSFAEENPEVAEAFAAAMQESLAGVEADQEGARELLPDFIEISPEAAQNLRMERLDGEIPKDEISQISELAVRYEFIGAAPADDDLYID
ncbi:ABC transporter substrate-binding protein [Citricoccus muralis]|uniref:ABC transporter substrate-binding protein n=1 Tax=Citricoccus muralis TaxID=169134 RepID=A0ABY8H5I4_9MICC|nr:ABC transporter substrate-binding protein [Citricoccus muralis]WFP16109.1 ABC transporter substrate-binding protein [Citricoccus muralis]